MLNCPWVPRKRKRVKCFMEGQGVDGRVNDDFLCFCVYLHPRWLEMVLKQCYFPCTALNVKAARNSKQTRVNDKSNNASL